MRIAIWSDLHQELARGQEWTPPPPRADVLVLAGDIDLGWAGLAWAWDRFGPGPKGDNDTGLPVVYVAGNHEHYGSDFNGSAPDSLLARGHRLTDGTNVHLLEGSSVVIHGVRFLGATLWTSLEIGPSWVSQAERETRIAASLRDYDPVDGIRGITPGRVRGLHRETVAWLARSMASSAEPCVVVTHHAPSARSLGPRLVGDISGGYASDLEGLIAEYQPLLWIHGHTHHPVDYRLGKTRVISNPRGYPGRILPGFREELVVDLDAPEQA